MHGFFFIAQDGVHGCRFAPCTIFDNRDCNFRRSDGRTIADKVGCFHLREYWGSLLLFLLLTTTAMNMNLLKGNINMIFST
jgi:hypothetical protein